MSDLRGAGDGLADDLNADADPDGTGYGGAHLPALPHGHGIDLDALIAGDMAALESAASLAEVVHLEKRAAAICELAGIDRQDRSTQNRAACHRIRTQRAGGRMLAGTPGLGTRGGDRPSKDSVSLESLGLHPKQSARWQLMGRLPDDQVDTLMAAVLDDDEAEITVADVYRLAQQMVREERAREIADLPIPDFPEDEAFPVLLADPPWRFESATTPDRKADNQYPTMNLVEICDLEVPAADDAVLFLWAPSSKLAEALEVIAAWGFRYQAGMVWVKDRIGLGSYVRNQHEHVLIATRGEPGCPIPADRPSSVIEAPRGEHSAKPAAVHEAIERMYPHYRRVELFAREKRDGWTVWGNEV